MELKSNLILLLLYSSFIYCSQECKWINWSHTFEIKEDTAVLFTAEIKDPDGLVIDLMYGHKPVERIKIASHDSAIYQMKRRKDIESVLSEGLHRISMDFVNQTLVIKCTSSDMVPVTVNELPRVQSVVVSAIKLEICEERCNIETTMEKIIENEDVLRITAFVANKDPITFETSYLNEGGKTDQVVIKPHVLINPANATIPFDNIKPGWNILNVFVNRSTLSIQNQIILTEVNLKAISIYGSYFVNCKKGTPQWIIQNKEEIKVPISFSQALSFGLTSTTDFYPVFNINGIRLPLTWKNGLKYGDFGPLFRHKSYNIIFEAMPQKLVVHYENKQHLLLELKVDEIPEFISVSSDNGDYILTLFVQESDQLTVRPEPSTENPLVDLPQHVNSESVPPSTTWAWVIIVLVIISILAISVVIIILQRRKLMELGKYSKYEDGSSLPLVVVQRMSPQEMADEDGEYIEIVIEKPPSPSSSRSSLTKDTENSTDSTHFLDGERENLSNIDKQLRQFGKNQSVTRIMEKLEDSINSTMEAIKHGKLYGPGSADSILRLHGLPGTIRDKHGNSMLHHLVLPIENINPTQWNNTDLITKFIKEHKIFISAVNYEGQTSLHYLMCKAPKKYSLDKCKNMTQLLLDIGCNPRAYDNDDKLPEDIASSRGIPDLVELIKRKQIIGEGRARKQKEDKWPSLLKKVKENDIESVTQLILQDVPFLPLSESFKEDPLTEALLMENIEMVMLLLSAGAPLCVRPLYALNSLVVSHSKPRITSFLSALIRREFCNCLWSESENITSKEDDLIQLKQTVIKQSEMVRKHGYTEANWDFKSDSGDILQQGKEARKMLRLAAKEKMVLTCQMMGLNDGFLTPLPLEISPSSNANKYLLLILARDLGIMLSPGEFAKFIQEDEETLYQMLKYFCKQNSIDFQSLFETDIPVKPMVLKYIAENGLYISYNKILRGRNVQIVNEIVDKVTGFTMLHCAAYNGQMSMVEYLLLNNADVSIKTKYGLNAAHVAALRGHRECLEYILAFAELSQSLANDLALSGLTAHQMFIGYTSEVKNIGDFLIHESYGHPVLSEPNCEEKAKLILNEKRMIIKDCISNGSLDHVIPQSYKDEHKHIWPQLREETENFIKILSDIDPRFKGKTIHPHRFEDELELLLMDSYQIYLEIKDNESLKDSSLPEAFEKSALKVLQNYRMKSKNLCIVPPSFERTSIGANVFVTYCSEKITTQIRIHIIPVFKEKINFKMEGLESSEMFNTIVTKTTTTHIAYNKNNKQSYVMIDLQNQLLDKIDHQKLVALNVCRLIRKILCPHWWFPRTVSTRHGRQWHYYAQSIPSASERLLASCFLLDAYQLSEDKLDSSNILNRVIDIYEQMVIQETNGNLIPSSNASSFLDPNKEAIKVYPSITVIIDFLRDLTISRKD